MPQNGFHGLVGLATARAVAKRAQKANAEPLVAGIVLGAMLPDIDLYPTAVAFLAGRKDLIYVIHRTLTHSAFLLAVLLVAGLLAKKPAWRFGLLGLGIGMATHLVLDVFFWFAGIDLFWPLSHLPADQPMLPFVNLWQGVKITDLALNIREAFEYCAFALLLMALGRVLPQKERLLRWQQGAWALFAVTLGTAFLFRDKPSMQNIVVETPYLLAFLPFCWLQVWKGRAEITAWCLQSVNTQAKADM